jgi:hypothetical protein
MLYLLAAILTGHALGNFVVNGRTAYLLCLPSSAVAYIFVRTMLAMLRDVDMASLPLGLMLVTGVFYAPLAMLGVCLARRKARRGFDE